MVNSLEEFYESTDIWYIIDSIGVTINESPYLGGSKLAFSYDDIIVVRDDLCDEIRQFVILHELGHLLLHEEPIYTFRINTNTYKIEKEANDFALLLLSKYHELDAELIRLRLNDWYKLNL